MPRSILLPGLVGFLLASFSAMADHPSVRSLCAEADAIVLGRVVEGDNAIVERWFLQPPGSSSAPSEIRIETLSAHCLKTDRFKAGLSDSGDERLGTTGFVAFLKWTTDRWRPLSTFPMGNQLGSDGIVWLQDGTCWAYINDNWNDGLYRFADLRSRAPFVSKAFKSPANEAALCEEIASGVAEAQKWQALLAEPDSEEKAHKLAAYYLDSTSPAGSESTFIGKVSDHLLPMKEKALPAMIEALAHIKAGDDTSFLLYGLSRIDVDIQQASPALIRLIQRPDLVSPYHVLHALGRTRDPLMAPFLMPYLIHENGDIRAAAYGALGSITFDRLTPTERANESPYVAIIYSFQPPTYSSNQTIKTSVRRLRNLKGDLPHSFTIDQIPPRGLKSNALHVAFLRQDEQGRIVPTEGEWLKPCRRFTSVFWNTHWIPMEEIMEAIPPGQKSANPPELAGRPPVRLSKQRE